MEQLQQGPLIVHPSRLLISGRSRMGKTTFAVKLICQQFRRIVDRIIIVCPTYNIQDTFDPIRKLVQPCDVYTRATKEDFVLIYKSIKKIQEFNKSKGNAMQRILILVDDMAGTPALHGSRISPFAHLSIQTPHWSTSMIVITQQPTNVSPSFRDNAEAIVVFPSEGVLEVEWLYRCYSSLMMNEGDMKRIILKAWRGGRKDNQEWGKHFLFIECTPRRHSQFWIDFDTRIYLKNEKDKK